MKGRVSPSRRSETKQKSANGGSTSDVLLPGHPLHHAAVRLPRAVVDAARPRALLPAAGGAPQVPARVAAADLAHPAHRDRHGPAGLHHEAVPAVGGQHAVRRRQPGAVHVRHHRVRGEHRQGPAHGDGGRVRRGGRRGGAAGRRLRRDRRPRRQPARAGRQQHHPGAGAGRRAGAAGRTVVRHAQGGGRDRGDESHIRGEAKGRQEEELKSVTSTLMPFGVRLRCRGWLDATPSLALCSLLRGGCLLTRTRFDL